MALSETLSADRPLVELPAFRLEADGRPGDCLIFNCRTHHSAAGNRLTATRRRALSTCWFGDKLRYRDKPYETDPPGRGEGLVPGGPMAGASFPRIL